jgi:hypothetical protein
MSRFGTGLGFNIQDIALISGIATEIFSANVANYNGSTSYAEVTDRDLVAGRTKLVLTTKINTDDNNLAQGIFSSSAAGVNTEFGIRLQPSGSLRQDVNEYADFSANGIITAGVTYNVRLEFLGSTYLRTFVDDVMVINKTSGVPASILNLSNTSNRVLIGCNDGAGTGSTIFTPFNGRIWELNIFNRSSLTTEDLEQVNSDKCFGLYDQALKDDCILSVPQYEHAGFTGQGFIDQTGINTITPTDIPFTGSAQIECEA